jgi:exosortase
MGIGEGPMEKVAMTAPGRGRFIDGVLLVALVVLGVAAMRPVWADIVRIATHDPEHSYILVVPGIVAWLIWVRRERFRYVSPRWTWLGALVVLASWGLGAFGYAKAVLVAEHLAAIGVALGGALTIVGTRFFAAFAPAIAATVFLAPVPGMIRQQIALPLQEISARITYFLLDGFGVPIEHMGNVLTVNGNPVAVAEACNGMRMAAALVVVTYTFVFSTPLRQSVRVLLIALSPVIAILCNVIRLAPTALFFGYAERDTAELFHDVSGWAILVVALGILWGVSALLRWLEVPIEPFAVGKGWTP